MTKGIDSKWLLDWLGDNKEELAPGKYEVLQNIANALHSREVNPSNILGFSVITNRKKVGKVISVSYDRRLIEVSSQ